MSNNVIIVFKYIRPTKIYLKMFSLKSLILKYVYRWLVSSVMSLSLVILRFIAMLKNQ